MTLPQAQDKPIPLGTPIGGRPPWSASPEEVAQFIKRHGRPYDAKNDDYVDPGPFAEPVKAGKNSAIYNAHSYHTKVPPEGIVRYLEHYTRPGDLVLDPFCGSGMTGVACILTGRYAILNDLSPAATHIAYNYCTPVDLAALKREWERIRQAVKEEFDWLYGTTCDRCGGRATIQYTVWSDFFECKGCHGEIVLWDAAVVRELTSDGYNPPLSASARPGVSPGRADGTVWKPPTPADAPPKPGANGTEVQRSRGDVLDTFPCPHCGTPWRKTQLHLLRSDPVLTDYQCPRCRPARHQHLTTQEEKELISYISTKAIPYWYPTIPFESTREMWRGVHRDAGITRVCDFWTRRNLWALARLWHEAGQIPDDRLARAVLFALTGCLLKGSKTTRFNFWKSGNSTLTGTLYVGSFVTENNLLDVAERKMDDVLSGLKGVAALGHATATVTQHAGQDLPLPDNIIDYIFTDPPFGSNIFYSDVNLLWEAWLDYLTDERYDAVWNKSRKPQEGGKTLEDYYRLMHGAFLEMHRVLKPGRWASVVFHNSDDKVWDAIRGAAEAAGLTIENVTAFDKQQKSFKGVRGQKGLERVSNLDIVLNLRKPREAEQTYISVAGGSDNIQAAGQPTAVTAQEGNGDAQQVRAEAEQAIAESIEKYLHAVAEQEAAKPPGAEAKGQDPRGVQAIHSHVIQILINEDKPTTGVSLAHVVEVLNRYCKQVDGRWYLPGEEVHSASGRFAAGDSDVTASVWAKEFAVPTDEASAIEWVRAVIRARGPQLEGDLIDQFRLAAPTLKLTKEFRQVLEENFIFDKRRGRWRLPTPAEAEAKLRIKVRLLEHRADSILAGAIPAPDAEGLGQLLEDCFNDGLFKQAYELWGRINPSDLPPERRKALERKARVSRLRMESGLPNG